MNFFALSIVANAQTQQNNMSTAVPSTQADLSNVVANPRLSGAGLGDLTVDLEVQCFGTNLRGVPSVMRPKGDMRLTLNINGKDTQPIVFSPNIVYQDVNTALAKIWNKANPTSAELKTATLKGVGGVRGRGHIKAQLTGVKPLAVSLGSGGVIKATGTELLIKHKYEQMVGTQWKAVSPSKNIVNISPDGALVSVASHFAGAIGFCGGFISPLMLFFDEKRPDFSASSEFPIFPGAKTFWPEAKSPGYFLAHIPEGEEAITRADQLFGNKEGVESGFESLAKRDMNKDQLISKDELNGLVLWRDLNANGVSEASEISKLSEYGIFEISLKYHRNHGRLFGERAKIVETSSFRYLKAGKEKSGEVADVWFRPVLN